MIFIWNQQKSQKCAKPCPLTLYELGHEKMCLMSYANNKGADQPAHPRSLISAFVVRCLDSVMSVVSVTKITSLMLASVAEQASLRLTWSETPKDTLSCGEAQLCNKPILVRHKHPLVTDEQHLQQNVMFFQVRFNSLYKCICYMDYC